MYIHGLHAKSESELSKVQSLSKLSTCGVIYGLEVDYRQPPLSNIMRVCQFIDQNDIDVIVGYDMGGWLAANVGAIKSLPVVLLNPVVEPQVTLSHYYGLNDNLLHGYENFELSRLVLQKNVIGMVVLDVDDTVVDSFKTKNILMDTYMAVWSAGQGHQLNNLHVHINEIKDFLTIADMCSPALSEVSVLPEVLNSTVEIYNQGLTDYHFPN